jgi:hypothetical protein
MLIPADLEEKLSAFDKVMSGIETESRHIVALRQRFIEEFPWTTTTTQIEQMVQDTLGVTGWGWGWHRIWRDKFEAMGALPRMWTTLSRVRPSALRETGSYDHRVYLLSHTLTHLGHRERAFVGLHADCDMCWIGEPIPDEPTKIINLIKKLTNSYASGKCPLDLPPFFPGDRTGFGTFKSEWRGAEDYSRLGQICRLRPCL